MKINRRRDIPEDDPSEARREIDLSTLFSASRAVNSTMGLDQALTVILSNAKQLCDADQGSVMLLDPDGMLRIKASEGIPAEEAALVEIVPGEGVSGKVLSTGEPVLINDLPSDRRFDSFVPRERELHSAICIPLGSQGRTVGVLNLNLVQAGPGFSKQDMRLAQLFAEQAAMVIHKAQLLEQAHARANELSALLEAAKAMADILDVERLLNKVLESGMHLLDVDRGFICIYEDPIRRISYGVYRGLNEAGIRRTFGHPEFHRLLTGEGPEKRFVSEVPAFEGLVESGSAYVCPMRGEEGTKILLVLFSDHERPGDLRLCESFSAHSVLAIRNAQLYDRLHSKESELSAIVASVMNPVIVVDEEGHISEANPAAEELFSFSVRFLKGKPVVGSLGHSEIEELLSSATDEAREVSAGNPMPRIWKARTNRLHDASGRRGRVLVMEDVTAERETQKLRGEFVAVVGHELRTPITLIKGFAKTLLRRADDLTADQGRDALSTIETQTNRLERLVEDLLYVSRVETSRPPLHLEMVDATAVANQLVSEFQKAETAREFTLSSPGPVSLMLDRTKIEQSLYHLIDNACKYSPPGSPIDVSIEEEQRFVTFSVEDKGIGILSREMPRIFELFYQVDSSNTRNKGGTGIGLYISKAMVDAHGGHITVESVWGKGSTFKMRIPRDLSPRQSERQPGTYSG